MVRKTCEYDGKACRTCEWCIVKERPHLFEKCDYNIRLYGEEDYVEKPVDEQQKLDDLF